MSSSEIISKKAIEEEREECLCTDYKFKHYKDQHWGYQKLLTENECRVLLAELEKIEKEIKRQRQGFAETEDIVPYRTNCEREIFDEHEKVLDSVLEFIEKERRELEGKKAIEETPCGLEGHCDCRSGADCEIS